MRRRDLFWAENLARTTSGSKHQTVRFFPFRRKHAIAHGIDKVVVDALSLPRYSLMLEPQSLWHHTTLVFSYAQDISTRFRPSSSNARSRSALHVLVMIPFPSKDLPSQKPINAARLSQSI